MHSIIFENKFSQLWHKKRGGTIYLGISNISEVYYIKRLFFTVIWTCEKNVSLVKKDLKIIWNLMCRQIKNISILKENLKQNEQ